MRRVAVVLATAGGAGYLPLAPGTFGSAVGVAVYVLIRSWPLAGQAAVIAAITVIGIWASSEAARHFNREDPGQVVIDEVAGQMLTLLATGATMTGLVAGFLLFRTLDVVKPWPARQFERFPGGWGIMADDLMAAVYGNVVLQIAIRVVPEWM